MKWLLESSLRERIEAFDGASVEGFADKQADLEARFSGDESGADRLMVVNGDIATITIKGVLTEQPSFMAMLFGGGNVTYPDIDNALLSAEGDDNVSSIEMVFDSGGGTINGLFNTVATMQAITKPIKAIVCNMSASACYALATQADTIVATNRATMFGSVGILQQAYIDADKVTLTSDKAPKKAPDLSTDQGKMDAKEHLNAMHDLFVEAIAEGRGTDVENVNANFGQGGVLLADEALKRGMIDGILGAEMKPVNKPADAGGKTQEIKGMNLEQLKAEHGSLYAQVVADAKTETLSAERDRVTAHLTMGKSSGDMETAIEAINAGDEMTATHQATYMTAGMNRAAIEARGGENDDAGDDTPETDEVKAVSAGKSIMASAFAACGIKAEA